MFAFAIVERDTGVRDCSAATGSGSSRSTSPRTADRLRFASAPAGAAGRRRASTPSIDPVALHHYLTFHSVVPPPRTILRGVRKLPPATVRDRASPTARRTDHVYWAPDFTRAPRSPGLVEQRLAGRRARRAAPRRASAAWSPTSRSACCSPAGSTPAWSSACSPRQGQPGLQTFSIGFEAVGGESGDEFEYSDLVAERVRHRPPADPASTPTGCCPRSTRRSGDERADGQPRLRGVLPARPRRSPSTSRSCSPGRAPTRCSPATTGTRRWPAVPREQGAGGSTRRCSSTGPHAELARILEPDWLLDDDPCRDVRHRPLRPRRRRDRRGRGAAPRHHDHAGRRPGQAGRQHDDGLGTGGAGSRSSTTSWSSWPAACPPELKLAHGGKGVLKEAARR